MATTSVLTEAQLSRFTPSSIRAAKIGSFDPYDGLARIAKINGTVLAADLGGDKLSASRFSARAGHLRKLDETAVMLRSRDGAGYLRTLENCARSAALDGIALGVSYAGPLDGSRVLAGENLRVFVHELRERFRGDFRRLYASVTIVNDGLAGLLASALEAGRRFSGVRNVIFLVNGSGLNCAVLRDGQLFGTESGHVRLEPTLNEFSQRKSCEMYGAKYVCIENVAASRAGIEDIWARERGARIDGRKIAEALASGDDLARRLYTNSAILTAHLAVGVVRALNLEISARDTVLVGHGGTFQVTGYLNLVRDLIDDRLEAPIECFKSTDFSSNACLDGAAIAALLADSVNWA